MATIALVMTNGVGRMTAITASSSLIYDKSVSIVASGGNGSTSLNGPITSSTAITLPSSGIYTLNANSVANLQVYVGGQRAEQTIDWNTSGSGPNFTAIVFTFDLQVGDRVDLRIERSS